MAVVYMNGTDDNITPMFMSEELYKAASTQNKNLLKIEGGSHNDLPAFDAYRTAYLELIAALAGDE